MGVLLSRDIDSFHDPVWADPSRSHRGTYIAAVWFWKSTGGVRDVQWGEPKIFAPHLPPKFCLISIKLTNIKRTSIHAFLSKTDAWRNIKEIKLNCVFLVCPALPFCCSHLCSFQSLLPPHSMTVMFCSYKTIHHHTLTCCCVFSTLILLVEYHRSVFDQVGI